MARNYRDLFIEEVGPTAKKDAANEEAHFDVHEEAPTELPTKKVLKSMVENTTTNNHVADEQATMPDLPRAPIERLPPQSKQTPSRKGKLATATPDSVRRSARKKKSTPCYRES